MHVQARGQQNFEDTLGIAGHDVTLEQLAAKIAAVYERCGFDKDASMSTLQMLTNVEVGTKTPACVYNHIVQSLSFAHM